MGKGREHQDQKGNFDRSSSPVRSSRSVWRNARLTIEKLCESDCKSGSEDPRDVIVREVSDKEGKLTHDEKWTIRKEGQGISKNSMNGRIPTNTEMGMKAPVMEEESIEAAS